jgi:uncharacterized surface protein with fasciclin (FAS1) repeats
MAALRFLQDQVNTHMFYHYENQCSLHEIVNRMKNTLTHNQLLRASVVVSPVAERDRSNPRTGARAMKFEIANLVIASVTALGMVAAGASARAAEQDIVDTAVAAGQSKTLATALGGAGLVATLKGTGPFTVFAPTDAAFAKLPAGTVENLLKPENKDKLTAILTYHVVPGRVMAADVGKVQEAKTVNGKMLTVSAKGGAVMINDAKVTSTDITASNGVIHVIDSVILP